MKKLIAVACLAASVGLFSGTARAENIGGRVGVTGKLGFVVPEDNDAEFGSGRRNKTDTGIIGGVGIMYGIDSNWAAEWNATHSAFDSDTGEFGVTNLSAGMQYRFRLAEPRELVPYAGAGLDIILTDYDPNDGTSRDVDTTLGAYLSGGADFFLTRDLALTAEAKVLLAREADITDGGRHSGDFDPTAFSSTIGVRYFFN
jgi:outer membrane protein